MCVCVCVGGGGGGLIPYMGYIGMCCPSRVFSAILVINRVRVLGSGARNPTPLGVEMYM